MLLSQITDLFKPVYYKIEKSVAAKQIPAVHEIKGRKKLADYPVSSPPGNDEMHHSLWDGLLRKYVDTNPDNTLVAGDNVVTGIHLVDYEGMGSDPDFTTYLDILAKADPTKLAEPEQIAFWMNAYNALCISKLVNGMQERTEKKEPPLNSINDLSKPDDPVWGQTAGIVAGTPVSLDHIEHEQLRKVWAEPAVHACIVCASASCPNLRPEAFVGSKVRAQMDDQFRLWLQNDTKGLKLEGKHGNRLVLSRIFLWFGDDFGGWDGLREYLPQYLDDESLKQKIRNNQVKVRFFEYSWKMNRQAHNAKKDTKTAAATTSE